MKKQSKALLIGFIVLCVAGLGVMWTKTLFKKPGFKKQNIIEAIKGIGKKELPETPQEEPQTEAVSVRCYKVGLTDFKDDLPVMGTIKGALEIQLKFEISGPIETINFRQGDVMGQGDIIAGLNKKDARLKLDYAKNKLESAKTQSLALQKKLEMHKKLYDIGGIIKAKLEEVELEAKAAEFQAKSGEVEVKSAEEELKKTDLYAPREGVLGSLDVEIGEFVTPADRVGVLYDIGEVFVELGIVENDINKVTLGQKVTASVDAHPGEAFNGVIDYLFPVVEGKSKTLTVRSRIKNPDASLLPGMFVRSLITVAEFKNAMVIPSMSLNKTDEGYRVFVVDEEKKVRIRPVQVAYVTTDYSVIQSGLSEGELVVTETPQELKEEMPVEVVEVQESSPGKEAK